MHVFLVPFVKKEKKPLVSFFVLFAYLFSKERNRKLEVGWVVRYGELRDDGGEMEIRIYCMKKLFSIKQKASKILS